MPLSARRIRRLSRALLGLLSLLVVASLTTAELGDYRFADLLRLLAESLETYRAAGHGIYLLAFFVAAMMGIVPLSLIAVLGGALFGVVTAFLLSTVALLTSSVAAFLLARYAFREPVRRWLSRHLALARIDEEIARRGWHFVLLLRLSPVVPFSLGSYAFGLTRVGPRDFFIGTLGALPALFACTYTGALSGLALAVLGGRAAPGLPELLFLGIGLLCTLVAMVYIIDMARKAVRADLLKPAAPSESPP